MFCREQVAQLRDARPEIQRRGAELVVVGNGSAFMAQAFREDLAVDFPLYTDPSLATYKALLLKRDVRSTFSGRSLKNAARALAGGHLQHALAGDAWQQGGVFVIAPPDRELFAYASAVAGDHPSTADILAALPSA